MQYAHFAEMRQYAKYGAIAYLRKTDRPILRGDPAQPMVILKNQTYTVFQKNQTPKTFYYNFVKIALISIGTQNLHVM